MSFESMPQTNQDPKAERREFPATEAPDLGREIDLELQKIQANTELARDTVLALEHLANSEQALAHTMALLESRHGAIVSRIEREKLMLLMKQMSPAERQAFIKKQKAQRPIVIEEKDLPTEAELKALGIETH
jgi:hypothetical protein